MSENDHQIFSAFSPGKILSTQKIESITGDNRHRRGGSDINLAEQYHTQIRDLKEHIKRLEN